VRPRIGQANEWPDPCGRDRRGKSGRRTAWVALPRRLLYNVPSSGAHGPERPDKKRRPPALKMTLACRRGLVHNKSNRRCPTTVFAGPTLRVLRGRRQMGSTAPTCPAGAPPVTEGPRFRSGPPRKHATTLYFFQGSIDEKSRIYNRAPGTPAKSQGSSRRCPHRRTDEHSGVEKLQAILAATLYPQGGRNGVSKFPNMDDHGLRILFAPRSTFLQRRTGRSPDQPPVEGPKRGGELEPEPKPYHSPGFGGPRARTRERSS